MEEEKNWSGGWGWAECACLPEGESAGKGIGGRERAIRVGKE